MSSYICLYGMVLHTSICHSRHGRVSSAVVLHNAAKCAYCPAPFHLLHQASMSNSETMFERRLQRGTGWQLRLRTKEPPHYVTYALLRHSCSSVLHSPSKVICSNGTALMVVQLPGRMNSPSESVHGSNHNGICCQWESKQVFA